MHSYQIFMNHSEINSKALFVALKMELFNFRIEIANNKYIPESKQSDWIKLVQMHEPHDLIEKFIIKTEKKG